MTALDTGEYTDPPERRAGTSVRRLSAARSSFITVNPLSGIRALLSGIRDPLFGIRDPLSGIRCPLSGIRSGIRDPLSGDTSEIDPGSSCT